MSEFTPEELPEGQFEDVPAEVDEYVPDEQLAAVSEETGTAYDELGEPEATPHDLAAEPADEE